MKKLFSFSAFCALLYAAPARANFFLGLYFIPEISFYGYFPLTFSTLFPTFVLLIIQALLLRYILKDISFLKALLMTCIGNIPSTLMGIFLLPLIWPVHIGLLPLMPFINTGLMMITISPFFHYPMKRLFVPVLIGNIIGSIIAILFSILSCA